MIEVKKYELLQIYCRQPATMDGINFWYKSVAQTILDISKDSILSIFTTGPNENSIGYDVGRVQHAGKFNSTRYLVTALDNPTIDDIKIIVGTDEFYLGFIILVLGAISERDIQNLIIMGENNLVQAGVECFRMDTDGASFYWYNPKSSEAATQILKKLATTLSTYLSV